MKVNYVKTIGFRKFKKVFETDLYDISNITGKNRSGKSNLLFAIINIILGTNLSGDEKTCLVNKKCDASYGELHFTDNGGHNHILIRVKDKYDSKKNSISLDGRTITQLDLIGFYKDKKLFLSILNPLYFLSKKPAEQKELVDKYLSDIKPKNVFNTLNLDAQKTLLEQHSMSIEAFNKLNPTEQEDFINSKMLNIFMNIAYSNLDIEEQKLLEGIPLNIPTYISELNADIKKAQTLINEINGKIEYAQNIANTEIPKRKNFEKEMELSLARQELAFLNSNQAIVDKEKQKQIIDNLQKDILNKETEIAELSKRMKEGKQLYLQIKNGSASECPTCGQHIQDVSKQNTIEHMRENLTADFNRKNILETQKKDLAAKLMVEKCKYHALEGETTVDKAKQIAVAQGNVEKLEKEQQEIDFYNSEIEIKEQNVKIAKLDITKFNAQKEARNHYIEQVTKTKQVTQKLYISYIEEKMKLAKQYLKDVNIRFYSILKTTGEIKEDFVITYKNTPLSDLSRSETIATALEFANMFNQITRVNLPIFIDDYESCADYDFIKDYSGNSQLFISTVKKHKSLSIANYNNSNQVTVIKPVITRFRTMKILHKGNKDTILKVA